jgi:acetyl-CoA carboxylase biotin carboxyl carrier protein
VKEGDRVKKGQTVCIIEAMKLMNEIEVRLPQFSG